MTNLLYTQTIDRHTLNLNTIKSSQLYLSSMTPGTCRAHYGFGCILLILSCFHELIIGNGFFLNTCTVH
jgi:hypothetical protein